LAVGINSIWEIRQGAPASNVSGCGFNPENVNYITDLATTGSSGQSSTPTVSSATYTFASIDVNAYLFVQAGTSWTPGWYQITAVNLGVATLDAAAGHVVKYINPGAARTFQINSVAGVGTANDLTGGTFSVDYSQRTAGGRGRADLASTDATSVPPHVTSSASPFLPAEVGNFIHIISGTQWTTGIYEIVSVSGSTAALDRACGTAATPSGAGTANVGGPASLCTSAGFTDDIFFEQGASTAGSGSHVFFIQTGSHYATVQAIALTAAGTFQNPIQIRGYNVYRTDRPTGWDRPFLTMGANNFTLGAHWWMRDVIISTTGTAGLTVGSSGMLNNVLAINTSTTADRPAFTGGAGSTMVGCEGISYRGRAFSIGASTCYFGCVARDSDVGFYSAGGSLSNVVLSHCILESFVTAAFKLNAAISVGQIDILNCTFYGREDTAFGVPPSGLVLPVACGAVRLISNIFYGFGLAINVTSGDNEPGVYSDYNNFYNDIGNGTGTNILAGPNDKTVNPSFTSISSVTGTAGAFVAGNGRLVDTSKNFSSLGVVGGRDYVNIVFGSGVTLGTNNGVYGITSISTTTNPNDTLILDINPGTNTTPDKQYIITVGHNLLPTGSI